VWLALFVFDGAGCRGIGSQAAADPARRGRQPPTRRTPPPRHPPMSSNPLRVRWPRRPGSAGGRERARLHPRRSAARCPRFDAGVCIPWPGRDAAGSAHELPLTRPAVAGSPRHDERHLRGTRRGHRTLYGFDGHGALDPQVAVNAPTCIRAAAQRIAPDSTAARAYRGRGGEHWGERPVARRRLRRMGWRDPCAQRARNVLGAGRPRRLTP